MAGDILRVVIGILAAVGIYLLLASMIRMFTAPVQPDPDPTDLQSVHYAYRCIVCGAEVTMTAAPAGEVPDPPRHCREDMVLVVEAGR